MNHTHVADVMDDESLTQHTLTVMKKSTLRLLPALLAVMAAFLFAPSASAQKGKMTLGLSGGYATNNDGGYTNLFFQYEPIAHVRLAPEIGYVFRNDGKSAFNLAVDVHFPFRIGRPVSVYPLVGVVFNSWKYPGDNTLNRAGADFGAGVDFHLTNYLKLSLQGKYSLMNDVSGGFIGMGMGYVF